MRVRVFFHRNTFWWQVGWDVQGPLLWVYCGPWTFQIARG